MVCGVGGWGLVPHCTSACTEAFQPPRGLSRWRTRATLGGLVGRRIGDGLHMDSRRRVAHRCGVCCSRLQSQYISARWDERGNRRGMEWIADIDQLEVSDWTGLRASLHRDGDGDGGKHRAHPHFGGLHGTQIMAKTKGRSSFLSQEAEGRRKRSRPPWRLLSIICLCLGLQVAAAVRIFRLFWSCVCGCVDFDWDLKSWSQKVTRCSKRLERPTTTTTWLLHPCSTRCTPGLLRRSRIV